MKKMCCLIVIGMTLTFASLAYGAPAVDVIQSPTGYFVPDNYQTYNSPYYRRNGQDWGWTHNAIGVGGFSNAVLKISAWDVDADYLAGPEVDKIYAFDNGTKTYLGSLRGATDSWAYTDFILDSKFFDDIQNGLQVWIEIDANGGNWAVTLAKSSLSLDGGEGPGPVPGAVPEPLTMLLLGLGLMGISGVRRLTK